MAEVAEESTHVWTAKQRMAVLLAAMRHFRDELRAHGWTVLYRELLATVGPDRDEPTTLADALVLDAAAQRPEQLVVVAPGEFRVREALQAAADQLGVPLEIRPDRHFLSSTDEFAAFAAGRKRLRMEYFYRQMRRRHGVLMDGDQTAGGRWNYDAENRASFPADGPGMLLEPLQFTPDAVSTAVIDLVNLAIRESSRHPRRLRLARDCHAGAGQARGLHRASTAKFRPLPGRHLDR